MRLKFRKKNKAGGVDVCITGGGGQVWMAFRVVSYCHCLFETHPLGEVSGWPPDDIPIILLSL